MPKRFLSVMASILVVVACSDEPTQPDLRAPQVAEAAIVVDGQPGQRVFTRAVIDVLDSFCEAVYDDPENGNTTVSSRFLPAEAFHVVANKNQVKATCKFLDTSGIYEGNAETGPVESCTLRTADGTYYYDGTGRLTSANNIVDDVDGVPFGTGGQTTLQCTFDLKGG